MPAELRAAHIYALDPSAHGLREPGGRRLDRRDVDPHAAHANAIHVVQQCFWYILVHVHDTAAARDADLAHGVEHAGVVATISARLHEDEALHAKVLR